MNPQCARCGKVVYPTEKVNCLDKVSEGSRAAPAPRSFGIWDGKRQVGLGVCVVLAPGVGTQRKAPAGESERTLGDGVGTGRGLCRGAGGEGAGLRRPPQSCGGARTAERSPRPGADGRASPPPTSAPAHFPAPAAGGTLPHPDFSPAPSASDVGGEVDMQIVINMSGAAAASGLRRIPPESRRSAARRAQGLILPLGGCQSKWLWPGPWQRGSRPTPGGDGVEQPGRQTLALP